MLGRWTGLLVAGAVALVALGYGYYGTESRQIRRERYQAITAIGALKADQLQLWRLNTKKQFIKRKSDTHGQYNGNQYWKI